MNNSNELQPSVNYNMIAPSVVAAFEWSLTSDPVTELKRAEVQGIIAKYAVSQGLTKAEVSYLSDMHDTEFMPDVVEVYDNFLESRPNSEVYTAALDELRAFGNSTE